MKKFEELHPIEKKAVEFFTDANSLELQKNFCEFVNDPKNKDEALNMITAFINKAQFFVAAEEGHCFISDLEKVRKNVYNIVSVSEKESKNFFGKFFNKIKEVIA